MTYTKVLIAFSPHRVETLSIAKKLIESSDIVILEEPFSPAFYDFLKNKLSLEEYLEQTEFGFPCFERESLSLLKDLSKQGKKILQVEPYFEVLNVIRKELDKGKSLSYLKSRPILKRVYEVESKATEKLLEYYESTLQLNFNTIVKKVIEFSQADAERFILRDKLRAKKIAKILKNFPGKRIYIEAGTIHIYFKKLLHLLLKKEKIFKLNSTFLLSNVLKPLIGKYWIFPPGELLTLRQIFKVGNTEEFKLLAARSLIYIKIIPKEELLPTEREPFPHLKRELEAIKLVECLNYKDCEKLYFKLFPIKAWEECLLEVKDYLRLDKGFEYIKFKAK